MEGEENNLNTPTAVPIALPIAERLTKTQSYIVLGALAIAVVFASAGISELVSARSSQKPVAATEEVVIPQTLPDFPQTIVEARAAVVFDIKENKVLFSKNAEAQLPLASLTKIMTAYTALELLPQNSVVTIKPEFLLADGSSGFRIDQQWRLKDLLEATLVESSNDGAQAIAGTYNAFLERRGEGEFDVSQKFLRAMNDHARTLGLTQTYFLNPTGLDENPYISGGNGSAFDMAKLMAAAVIKYPHAFSATGEPAIQVSSLGETRYDIKNTNPFVDQIPGLIASKTGFTDLAGGNLAVVFDAGPMHPVAVVVLGSSANGRFTDTLSLVNGTFQYLYNLTN
jgi:D-alanyl-D-alanine carboxypeptidase